MARKKDDAAPAKSRKNVAAVAKAPRGRPTVYAEPVASEILGRLAAGESLREICRSREDMPSEAAVRLWVLDDREGFAARYTRAREMGADAIADELLEISDDGRNDWMERRRGDGELETVLNAEHVQRSKLRVEARKWLLAKIVPKRYGERQAVEHSGPEGGALKFVIYGAQEAKDADEWAKLNPPPV